MGSGPSIKNGLVPVARGCLPDAHGGPPSDVRTGHLEARLTSALLREAIDEAVWPEPTFLQVCAWVWSPGVLCLRQLIDSEMAALVLHPLDRALLQRTLSLHLGIELST